MLTLTSEALHPATSEGVADLTHNETSTTNWDSSGMWLKLLSNSEIPLLPS